MKAILLMTIAILLIASQVDAQAPVVAPPSGRVETTANESNGIVREVGNLQARIVIQSSGIKLFVSDAVGDAISLQGTRGVVALVVEGNPKSYRYDMFPAADGSLSTSADLRKLEGHQVELRFQTIGLKATDLDFREVTIVPANDKRRMEAAIKRQKLCPVSGHFLGSGGDPIAVDVKGQTIFVCCAQCTEAVKSEPLKFASGRPVITVSSATKADEQLVKRQVNCPVMDEPLGSMGHPIKVTVGKQPIFLCCKGCIKKVQADPAKYLAAVTKTARSVEVKTAAASLSKKVAGQEVRQGVFRVTKSDTQYVAAQKRCPVMDEPLDAMGGPYRVNAAGKAIYICCPGCAKKIFAKPQEYLGILNKQGVSPPLLR